MPPTTTTTKDSMTMVDAHLRVGAAHGAGEDAGEPGQAEPIPKTSSQMRLRSMPSARTIRGSREPARMMRPTLVR